MHYYLGLHFALDKIKTAGEFYSCELSYHTKLIFAATPKSHDEHTY